MSKLIAAARNFVRDEEGATAAEYALLVALIAVVLIVGARELGSAINTRLDNTAREISAT